MKERRDRLKEALRSKFQGKSPEGFLFFNRENIRYLTGFSGSEAVLFLGEKRDWVLTDSRYEAYVREELECASLFVYKEKIDGISSFFKEKEIKGAVGFEEDSISYLQYKRLARAIGARRLHSISKALGNIREIKSLEEIALIKEATGISEKAFDRIRGEIEEGTEEAEIAARLDCEMRLNGSEGNPFEVIVASGARSAFPHSRPAKKRLERGELLLLDWGATFGGYCSDISRTLVIGRPDKKKKRIYQILLDAQERAISAVRPGVKCSKIDKDLREYLERHDLAKYFNHATGHGIGLAVHESPHISSISKDIFKEGMIFTVEPGIYIPGWGGMRIEDIIHLKGDGAEVLTSLKKKELITIQLSAVSHQRREKDFFV